MDRDHWDRLAADLAAIPYEPRSLARPRYAWLVTKTTFDYLTHNEARLHNALVRLNPYPAPFERVRIPAEGATLDAWLGLQPDQPKPTVLFVPGTFATKDDTVNKAKALRLFREAPGFNVLIVDQRDFGGSFGGRGSGGYLEALDLRRAADWLCDKSGAAGVALVGESLGAAASIIAAGMQGRDGDDGAIRGVLAWSPFADVARVLSYVSERPAPRHPFYGPYLLFRTLLKRATGGETDRFDTFFRARATELGLADDELVRLASPLSYLDDVNVPVLAVNSRDDPIVPFEHGELLAKAAGRTRWVRTLHVGRALHTAYVEADAAWYWTLTTRFLTSVLDTARQEAPGNVS